MSVCNELHRVKISIVVYDHKVKDKGISPIPLSQRYQGASPAYLYDRFGFEPGSFYLSTKE